VDIALIGSDKCAVKSFLAIGEREGGRQPNRCEVDIVESQRVCRRIGPQARVRAFEKAWPDFADLDPPIVWSDQQL
jgi:hypothetical protein